MNIEAAFSAILSSIRTLARPAAADQGGFLAAWDESGESAVPAGAEAQAETPAPGTGVGDDTPLPAADPGQFIPADSPLAPMPSEEEGEGAPPAPSAVPEPNGTMVSLPASTGTGSRSAVAGGSAVEPGEPWHGPAEAGQQRMPQRSPPTGAFGPNPAPSTAILISSGADMAPPAGAPAPPAAMAIRDALLPQPPVLPQTASWQAEFPGMGLSPTPESYGGGPRDASVVRTVPLPAETGRAALPSAAPAELPQPATAQPSPPSGTEPPPPETRIPAASGPPLPAEGAAPASRQRTILVYRAAALPVLPDQAPTLPSATAALQIAGDFPDPPSGDTPAPQGPNAAIVALPPAPFAVPPLDSGAAGLVAADVHGPPSAVRSESPAPAPASQPPPTAPPVLTARDGEIDLRLAPEELGRVQMTLRQEGDLMRVHIQADRPETLDLLRRNAGELASDLRAAGYEGSSFSFGGSSRGQDQRAAQTAATAAADPAPPRPPPPAAMAGALDLRL